MTITLDTGYPISDALSRGSVTTPALPSATSGNLFVFFIGAFAGTGSDSAVSDTSGFVGTMTRAGSWVDSTNNNEYEIWTGLVTSTGQPTIAFTTSAGSSCEVVAMSLHFSGTAHWRLVGSTEGITNASSPTTQFPTVVSDSSADQAYIGYLLLANVYNNSASTGFTGFSTTDSNNFIYDLALSSSTSYNPTMQQSATGFSSGIAAIFSADAAVVPYAPPLSRPSFVPQMRASTW